MEGIGIERYYRKMGGNRDREIEGRWEGLEIEGRWGNGKDY